MSSKSKPARGQSARLRRPKASVARQKPKAAAPTCKLPTDLKILAAARSIVALQLKVESKEAFPQFRGSAAPTSLGLPHPGYACVDTKESALLRLAMSRLFAGKEYDFRISAAVNMSASGAGLVNSVITNITLASQTDFSALSSVFSEFFVVGFKVRWQPVSRYNYPLTGVTATSVANVPIGVAALEHSQIAYTGLSEMTNNDGFQLMSTGDPFTFEWKNSEKRNVDTVISPGTSTTTPTQSWCMVGDAANYTGQIQFLSNAVPPPVTPSAVLGVFAVDWHVAFRVRL